MSWIWSALMPHPPVLIPEIGRGREFEAIKTLEGIKQLTSGLKKPDLLLILSPHQPYASGALFVNTANSYNGSFALFGVPDIKVNPVSPADNTRELCEYLQKSDVEVYTQNYEDLTRDQGSMIPLYFLQQEWKDLPEVIIASPIGLTPQKAFELGKILANFKSNKNLALLASGDLSH